MVSAARAGHLIEEDTMNSMLNYWTLVAAQIESREAEAAAASRARRLRRARAELASVDSPATPRARGAARGITGAAAADGIGP
jgi:hypothetical protein